MLKSIIVDDEKHGRENLAGILREYCPEVEVPGEAASVEAALSLIREQPPDLVFPDIEMPRASGFQLLEHLQDSGFVRAHKTHLINLKHVVAYLKSGSLLNLKNGE